MKVNIYTVKKVSKDAVDKGIRFLSFSVRLLCGAELFPAVPQDDQTSYGNTYAGEGKKEPADNMAYPCRRGL